MERLSIAFTANGKRKIQDKKQFSKCMGNEQIKLLKTIPYV